MGQNAPHYVLDKLPPLREKVETIRILRQTNKSTAALAELKGIARSIPNQTMLINAIVLQEAKDSSEIENIITTQDELYKALIVNKTNISPEIKEVVNYRKAGFQGKPKLYPWARAYKIVSDEENTLIFTITRNNERENSKTS